jgi:DNA-binding transcriptional ArsR family regulator
LKQLFAVSAPLVLASAISLTFRAVGDDDTETSSFDPWLRSAQQVLPLELQHDLGLLLGFSGRLLYYAEELLLSFDALEPDRLEASYDEYFAHLQSLPAIAFKQMAANAVRRVYRDRGVFETPPESDDAAEWRMFLRPSITRADINEAAAIITNPDELKRRTLGLLDGFWRGFYQQDFERNLPDLERAVRRARQMAHPIVQIEFSELTGHRLPDEIAKHLMEVERVTFCPSSHLGAFIQYIFYEPELILYFNPASVLQTPEPGRRNQPALDDDGALDDAAALAGFKAVADPTRLRIIEMLQEREHYAQEIVGRLGISQSAVSRHLATLESANIVTVRPLQGMKYYAVDRVYVRKLAGYLEQLAETEALALHR